MDVPALCSPAWARDQNAPGYPLSASEHSGAFGVAPGFAQSWPHVIVVAGEDLLFTN
jgi:hypothetical protein